MAGKKLGHSTYVIDGKREVCEVVLGGEGSFDNIMQVYAALLKDKAWSPGMNVIYDITKVTALDLSRREVQQIALEHAAMSDRTGQGTWCIIAEQDLAFGLARMYQGYASWKGPEIQVCRSRDEAEKILGIEP